MSLTISEDTARAALRALRATHCAKLSKALLDGCTGGFDDEDEDRECSAVCHGDIEAHNCQSARAWRELARLLGER